MKFKRTAGLFCLGLALVWLPSAQTIHPPGHPVKEMGTGAQGTSSDSIIVIRYDPAAIYLTHSLVSPLCSTEVKVAGEDGVSHGRMELVPMNDNELQPKGVFVGQARVRWGASAPKDAEAREALFDNGLDELRRALSKRLVDGRAKGLHRRLSKLQRMADDREAQLGTLTQQLVMRDRQRQLGEDAQRIRAMLQDLKIEMKASRETLMAEMSRLSLSETTLVEADVAREVIEKDAVRAKRLFDQGHISESELSKSRLTLQRAEVDLKEAESQLEAKRHELAAMESRVQDRENVVSELEAQLKLLKDEANALSAGEQDPLKLAERHMGLDIHQDMRREQLSELQVEVQRLTAQLETLRDVRVERW
ncbi:MAG: hypothetical protein AAGG01_00790 [Planctomycetota bacterium]